MADTDPGSTPATLTTYEFADGSPMGDETVNLSLNGWVGAENVVERRWVCVETRLIERVTAEELERERDGRH